MCVIESGPKVQVGRAPLGTGGSVLLLFDHGLQALQPLLGQGVGWQLDPVAVTGAVRRCLVMFYCAQYLYFELQHSSPVVYGPIELAGRTKSKV